MAVKQPRDDDWVYVVDKERKNWGETTWKHIVTNRCNL